MQMYSEAIEAQDAMLRHVRKIGVSLTGTERFKSHLYKGSRSDFHPALGRMALTLETAVPFYWDADLCAVLEAGAPTMPDWEVNVSKLPAQSGFIWFGRPLTLPMPSEDVIKDAIARGNRRADLPLDYRLDMTGIAWSALDGEDVFISTFLRNSVRLDGEPGLMHITQEGTTLSELISRLSSMGRNPSVHEGTDIQATHDVLMARRAELQIRYIAAALDFVNQPLLTTRRHAQPDRATRKRLARAGRPDVPDIHIIELRRKQYLSVDEPDEAPSEREYRHRWFVGMATGGYWQRFHTGPGRHETIRRLILPYMKLADRTDLPIKQPRQTVVVVDR